MDQNQSYPKQTHCLVSSLFNNDAEEKYCRELSASITRQGGVEQHPQND